MLYKGSAKSQHFIHSSSEFKGIQRQKNLLTIQFFSKTRSDGSLQECACGFLRDRHHQPVFGQTKMDMAT
jgi:hypothetical protein